MMPGNMAGSNNADVWWPTRRPKYFSVSSIKKYHFSIIFYRVFGKLSKDCDQAWKSLVRLNLNWWILQSRLSKHVRFLLLPYWLTGWRCEACFWYYVRVSLCTGFYKSQRSDYRRSCRLLWQRFWGFCVWAAGSSRPASVSTFLRLLMDVTHKLLLYNFARG